MEEGSGKEQPGVVQREGWSVGAEHVLDVEAGGQSEETAKKSRIPIKCPRRAGEDVNRFFALHALGDMRDD
ncbi:MAG: hypothetical protein VX893_14000 [Candidatus Latescibacterota bacterium]|nr:hypothetical protein [Candidatus Latescibacterota bacterium]